MMVDRQQRLKEGLNRAGREIFQQLRDKGYSDEDFLGIRLELTITRREGKSNSRLIYKPEIIITQNETSEDPRLMFADRPEFNFIGVTDVETRRVAVSANGIYLQSSIGVILNNTDEKNIILDLILIDFDRKILHTQRRGCGIYSGCTITEFDHFHGENNQCLERDC